MSKYTTGELAKLCDVTVRTVQYYDTRGILIPSELSEGGRRLYSDEDLKRLKTICFLRGIGLSLDGIANLFHDENASDVIGLLLLQQSESLKQELDDLKRKSRTVEQLTQELKSWQNVSVETIYDIAFTMDQQKKRRNVLFTLIWGGIFMDILEIGSLLLWIFKGIWWPFAVCMPIAVLCAVCLVNFYYKKTAYICPQCHAMFRPSLRQFFFSAHTPRTRKLICTDCGHKGFCVETYNETSDTK